MYQNLLREWIKTIPSKSNREYIKNSQEMVSLQVFAEWLDKQAAEHRLHTDDAYASCPHRAFVNYPSLGDVVECEYRIAGKA